MKKIPSKAPRDCGVDDVSSRLSSDFRPGLLIAPLEARVPDVGHADTFLDTRKWVMLSLVRVAGCSFVPSDRRSHRWSSYGMCCGRFFFPSYNMCMLQTEAESWIEEVYRTFEGEKTGRTVPLCWDEVEALYTVSGWSNEGMS